MYRILTVFCFSLIILLAACHNVAQLTQNQVNGMMPQWSLLGQTFSDLGQNLGIAEHGCAQSQQGLRGEVNATDDSLRDDKAGRLLTSLKADCRNITVLQQKFGVLKAAYVKARTEFNTFQTAAMNNSIADDEARKSLKEYQTDYSRLDSEAKLIQKRLFGLIDQHNRIAGELTELTGHYSSYKIIPKKTE